VTIWYPEPEIPAEIFLVVVALANRSALIRKSRRRVEIAPASSAKSLARFDPFGVSSNGAAEEHRADAASADGPGGEWRGDEDPSGSNSQAAGR
jgi:hypothetical protein